MLTPVFAFSVLIFSFSLLCKIRLAASLSVSTCPLLDALSLSACIFVAPTALISVSTNCCLDMGMSRCGAEGIPTISALLFTSCSLFSLTARLTLGCLTPSTVSICLALFLFVAFSFCFISARLIGSGSGP